MPIASKTRAEIRKSIGRNTGMAVFGAVTATGDTQSLIDTRGLVPSGDDDYNNWDGVMTSGTVANIGDQFLVSDFDGTLKDATISAIDAVTGIGDGYELWHPPIKVTEVNDLISDAETAAYKTSFIDKNDTSVFTQKNVQLYSIPTGFTHIDKIEYVKTIGESDLLGDALWTAGSNVTAAIDTELYQGRVCTKLTVSADAAAGAVLGYLPITSINLSNYDTIEFWIRSDIAQTAANLEFTLCSDAAGATAVDTISLPVLVIDTGTRVQLTMANPELDTAIASIALKQKAATDIGACKIWVEYPLALKASSRVYGDLSHMQWDIIHGSTDYLYLTDLGLNSTGTSALLRISGYQALTVMSADTSTSEIDPEYIVAYVSGRLMEAHALPVGMDTKARLEKAREFLNRAAMLRVQASTSLRQGTRKI